MQGICLGRHDDIQLNHMVASLRGAGVDATIIDTATFPAHIEISHQPAHLSYGMHQEGNTCELDDIRVFYWQRFYQPQCHSPAQLQNTISALSPLFYHQPERWFNPISAIRYHQAKPAQLAEARQLGATIPATLTTNNVLRLTTFCQQFYDLIIKPVFGGEHTEMLKRGGTLQLDLQQCVNNGPITVQQWIQGEDVRSFVIGDNVLSAVIASDATDYRTDNQAMAYPTDIPQHVKALSISICKQFGMKWCAIDWRKQPDGEYIFLEANPCPQFMRFEADTGLPITDALVNAMKSVAEH